MQEPEKDLTSGMFQARITRLRESSSPLKGQIAIRRASGGRAAMPIKLDR